MKWLLNLFSLFSSKQTTLKVENIKEEKVEKKIEPVDWALKITVKRKIFNECDTIGDLYVSYPETPDLLEFVCNTLEDKVRNPKGTKKEELKKIYGETAIPYGTYRVIISYSNAFKKNLPEILEVPCFEGIRIHGGNHKDNSLGCILVGDSPKISQTKSWIYNSQKNLKKFLDILEPAIKKGKVIIEIID